LNGFDITYVGALGGGFLSFLSPCVLPLVPAYLCFLTGHSLERLTTGGVASESSGSELSERGRLAVMLPAIGFVVGFSTIFVTLGASASAINQLLIGNLDILSKIAGSVIIVLGLHYMGLLRLGWLNREARFTPEKKPPGWIGAYVIGLAFGFGWTPCIGPILGAVLAVAASQEQLGYGISLLSVYSLGLGIPFLIAAAATGWFMGFLNRFRRHLHRVEQIAGVLLVITGLLIFTNSLQTLSYLMLELFPVLGTIG